MLLMMQAHNQEQVMHVLPPPHKANDLTGKTVHIFTMECENVMFPQISHNTRMFN